MSREVPVNDEVPRDAAEELEIPIAELRWQCIEDWLDFATTADVEPVKGVVGQDDALEALRFGLEIDAPGQNVYVRGLTGTGRTTTIQHLLTDIQPPCPPTDDRCYVHNFEQPDRPKLLTVPRGKGVLLARRLDEFIEFVKQQLAPELGSDTIRARRGSLDDATQKAMLEVGKPFEEELKANGLALIPMQIGQAVQPTIVPVIGGEPVPFDKFEELQAQGQITPAQAEEVHQKISEFARRFEDVSQKIREVQLRHMEALKALFEAEARRILQFHVDRIQRDFVEPEVRAFVQAVVDDLVTNRLQMLGGDTDFTQNYRVNPILSRSDGAGPVIRETSPTLRNLLGSIDREFSAMGAFRSDHMMIHAGALLRADGGYLILEAREVLAEPGSWKILVRTLKTGVLEIVPSEVSDFWAGPLLKPEPIPLRVKVILIGDANLYQMLDLYDLDFAYLFKVLADFDSTIPRDQTGVSYYAGVLARVIRDEGLLPFDRQGVMAMSEHGARIAGQRDKLTTRFGRLSDVAREANYVAVKAGLDVVSREQVHEAVRRGRRRADLPARHYRKLITDGTIRIQTDGRQVGQINGLAVIQAGPLTYGFPSRITASIGPGTAGAVNIEREAELSGSIHTKGFYILGGLLRNLLKTDHPLAFSASVAFEQSYGGIDGDSASGAEMVCLLSALTEVPLRQDLAMTGAIDQMGHIQPIGAVSEKVEGFFEVCREAGLTGRQGVVIPRANAGDLMLNPQVLEVCAAGRFHVYAVDTVHQALALFTGQKTGIADASGHYEEGTLLRLATNRARAYWEMVAQTRASPARPANTSGR
ncbi:MAG: ATP-binding protein [Pseudomonadales bacterium]